LEKAAGRLLLICFFEMDQRPSRRCVTGLAQRAAEFRDKGVTVLAIAATTADDASLRAWVKEQGIPFPVGRIKADAEQVKSPWGVGSLPWLILTDKNHVVRAEGFDIAELDSRIREAGQ